MSFMAFQRNRAIMKLTCKLSLSFGVLMAEIVVLEDDFTLLDLYRDVLERDGHKVYASTTVQAVQEFFSQNKADLCISDLRVGLLDGNRTIQALKQIVSRYNIPMI